MAPSLLAAAGLLLLFSFSSAVRGTIFILYDPFKRGAITQNLIKIFFFLNFAANQRRQHQDVHPKWWFCKCLIKRKKNWKHFCIFNLWRLIGVFQGKYCPTTCGVADYMRSYILGANRDIDELQQDLDTITNLTQGADETIQYIKDSVTVAQKSSPSGERWRHKVSLVTIDNPKKKKKIIL